MSDNRRTEERFWDKYWLTQKRSSKPRRESLQIKEIKKIFHRYLPQKEGIQVLEIGGGYGGYLMYLHDQFQYKVSSLDYSKEGNESTLQLFSDAHKEIRIFEQDLFGDLSDVPNFDIVFSLGFIEHFDDPLPVVMKHIELIKPGGILLIGVPNLDGIYKQVLRRTAPSFESSHNLKIMRLESWKEFEKTYNLQSIYTGYVGGFEPLNMKKRELNTYLARGLYLLVTGLTVTFSFHFSFLRRFNSHFWSGYMIGIYKKACNEL